MRILTGYLALAVLLAGSRLVAASETQAAWQRIRLEEAKQVQLAGLLAETFERGVARLVGEPYTLDWLLAEVSFKVDRILTNHSGDVSGRFEMSFDGFVRARAWVPRAYGGSLCGWPAVLAP
jgi:hypothetical protein